MAFLRMPGSFARWVRGRCRHRHSRALGTLAFGPRPRGQGTRGRRAFATRPPRGVLRCFCPERPRPLRKRGPNFQGRQGGSRRMCGARVGFEEWSTAAEFQGTGRWGDRCLFPRRPPGDVCHGDAGRRPEGTSLGSRDRQGATGPEDAQGRLGCFVPRLGKSLLCECGWRFLLMGPRGGEEAARPQVETTRAQGRSLIRGLEAGSFRGQGRRPQRPSRTAVGRRERQGVAPPRRPHGSGDLRGLLC